MNPLASLSSAVSRPVLAAHSTAARPGVDAQRVLATRLGLQLDGLQGKGDDFTPEQVAERVLGFIERRLQSEAAAGADPAKLKSLLSQARGGVEKGFAEARGMLDGIGVLQGKVAADIDASYRRIQDGLSDLDRRFDPAAPSPAEPVGVTASSERYSALAETFDLAVTTRDGDRLRISIAQASANWSQTRIAVVGNDSGSALVANSQSGAVQIGAWRVSVEGQLDDGERAALEKLIGQVQALSGQFYAGDLDGAFDRAMALDMDGEQLASMSLRLTQTRVRQATDTYAAVAEQGGRAASAVNESLIGYARGLLDALRQADALGQDGRGALQALLEGSTAVDERFDAARQDRVARFNSRLLDGLQGLLDSPRTAASVGAAAA